MAAISRNVGPTLVNATYPELVNCVNLGRYPVLKVVATDTYGLQTVQGGRRVHVFWNDQNRLDVCNLTRWTIVRTETGDHTSIDPSKVANELRPWYAAKKRSVHGVNPQPGWSNLHVELGNEPNNDDRFKDSDFIWQARWYLLRAIDVVRQLNREYGVTAKIICPALAPRYWKNTTRDQGQPAGELPLAEYVWRWLEIFGQTGSDGRNAIDDCDFVGVHFFARDSWENEHEGNGNNMRFVVDAYKRYVGSRRWWTVTEFGLRNKLADRARCDDYTKGYRNAGIMHFGEGPGFRTANPCVLPAHVWGGTYFKLDTFQAPGSTEQDSGYGYYYPNGDWSYRNRLSSGARPDDAGEPVTEAVVSPT